MAKNAKSSNKTSNELAAALTDDDLLRVTGGNSFYIDPTDSVIPDPRSIDPSQISRLDRPQTDPEIRIEIELHPNPALPIGGEAHVEGMYGSREDPGDSRGVTFPSTGL